MMMSEEDKDDLIKGLREENGYLRERVDGAADASVSLLKANQELQEKYENDVHYYQQQIEELKQDNHMLSNKLSLQTATHQAFNEEIEIVKSQAEAEYNTRVSILEQNHSLKLQKVSWELGETQLLVEKLQQNENSLKEKILQQERLITEMTRDAADRKESSDNTDELSVLQKKCNDYSFQIQELELMLSEKTQSLNQQQDYMDAQEVRHKELQESLDERVRLSNEIYHELQEAIENNKVLQCQLEKHRLDKLEENWHNSGNSLFGEVEERRLETERNLICLQVKYDTLDRTHQMMKQHFKRLKVDMSALLCRVGTFTADAAQVERLQRSLRQRNSEIQILHDKVYKLEEDKKCMSASEGPPDGTFERGCSYQLLQQKIIIKEKTVDAIKRELKSVYTQLLWEATKLTEAESKLYKSEQDRAKLVNDSTAMRLRLSEDKEKESELMVQLKVANKEIETLKLQLKSKLHKGQQAEENTSSNDTKPLSVVQPAQTKEGTVIIKKEAKPINLLEELEKENTVPDIEQSLQHKVVLNAIEEISCTSSIANSSFDKEVISLTEEKLTGTSKKLSRLVMMM